MFKLLKFTFKNEHFSDSVFSHKLFEYDVKEFTEQCKGSQKDMDKIDEKEEQIDEGMSSGEEEIDIKINDEEEVARLERVDFISGAMVEEVSKFKKDNLEAEMFGG